MAGLYEAVHLDAGQVAALRLLVGQLEAAPELVHAPELGFFREFVVGRLGATLPPPIDALGGVDLTSAESELEPEEDDGVVAPDRDRPQQMGDPSAEVDDAAVERAQDAKSRGLAAQADGDLAGAVHCFTDAVLANPRSAILYATRATAYVKLRKPNAALRDCDAALAINPDSARTHKARGFALALLGRWEDANKALQAAAALDFDEDVAAELKRIEPKVRRIQEHQQRSERRARERRARRDRKEAAKQEAAVAARKAAAKAAYDEGRRQSQHEEAARMASGGHGLGPGYFSKEAGWKAGKGYGLSEEEKRAREERQKAAAAP